MKKNKKEKKQEDEIITSPAREALEEMEIEYREKVRARINDRELNSYDLYEDIKSLYLLHRMLLDSLTIVQKVRKKRRC